MDVKKLAIILVVAIIVLGGGFAVINGMKPKAAGPAPADPNTIVNVPDPSAPGSGEQVQVAVPDPK